jgi:hypothetical protein
MDSGLYVHLSSIEFYETSEHVFWPKIIVVILTSSVQRSWVELLAFYI